MVFSVFSLLLTRVPKNRDIAEKWNIALGFEAKKCIYGFVCFEHFESDDFKRNDKTVLEPHAVPKVVTAAQNPSIQENRNSNTLELNDPDDSISAFQECSSTSVDDSVDGNNSQIPLITQCTQCVKKEYLISEKDYIISEKDEEIKELHKKLKKANAKIWYLEKIKRKLDSAFSELKQQKLLDENMYETLEV